MTVRFIISFISWVISIRCGNTKNDGERGSLSLVHFRRPHGHIVQRFDPISTDDEGIRCGRETITSLKVWVSYNSVRRISCRECMSDLSKVPGLRSGTIRRVPGMAQLKPQATLLICRPQFHRFSSKVPFSACILISPDISGPQSSLSRVAFSRSSALSSSAPFPSLETRLNNENSSWL
jgi:hypothetical protein